MPLVQDFSLIHTTAYNHCYLKPGFEDVMKKMKEALAAEVRGPLFGEDSDKLLPIGEGADPTIPLEYFERSVPTRPPQIRQGNNWATGATERMMDKTQGVIQASQRKGILFQEETYLSQHDATQQSVDEDSIEEEGHYTMMTQTLTQMRLMKSPGGERIKPIISIILVQTTTLSAKLAELLLQLLER